MRFVNLCLAACFSLLQTAELRSEPYAPRVGQRHEEFVLPSIVDGSEVALAQFRGKKVLLIHFASW